MTYDAGYANSMKFGAGRPIGHRGGRYVVATGRLRGFVVAWLETGARIRQDELGTEHAR